MAPLFGEGGRERERQRTGKERKETRGRQRHRHRKTERCRTREKETHAHKEEGSCSIVFCFQENIKDYNSVFLNSVFDVDAVRVMSVI